MEDGRVSSDTAYLLIREDRTGLQPAGKDRHQDSAAGAVPLTQGRAACGIPEHGEPTRELTAETSLTENIPSPPGGSARPGPERVQGQVRSVQGRGENPGEVPQRGVQGSAVPALTAPARNGRSPSHAFPPVLGACNDSQRRPTEAVMTSAEDGRTVTYVIEEAGRISTLDRLSLDSAGNVDTGDGQKRSVARAHCHLTPRDSGVDKKARFKLILASLLCLVFMVGECVGGVLAHSLAVVSDAAHLLTDFASFMISLMALYLASRPATKRLSFGWYRAEILGALVSILMLWVITGVLAYSAVLRVQSGDYNIDATIMLITSATGVFFNVVLGCTLHQHGHSHGGGGHGHSHGQGHGQGHSHTQSHPDPQPSLAMDEPDQSPLIRHNPGRGYGSIYGNSSQGAAPGPHGDPENQAKAAAAAAAAAAAKKKKASNINVKAAFIHVVGDFCQSLGVLVAAFIIYFKPEWKIADPICTFLFSALVVVTTVTIMRDILVVLMEGTPRNINFEQVRDSLLNMEGVKDLHDLRVWSLTMDKTALSVHLAVERGMDPMLVVQATSRLIQQQYNITQTTIQVEEYVDEMRDCTRCQHLKD